MEYIGFFDEHLFEYITLMVFILPIAIIGFIATLYSLIKKIKNKQNFSVLVVILIIIGLYFSQILSITFSRLASDVTYEKDLDKYYNLAIKTSIFPSQRAFYKEMYAGDLTHRFKNYSKALKYYYQVYDYTQSYRPSLLWFNIISNEIKMNNLDKALEIAKEMKKSFIIADIYLLKKDYKTAINYYNKAIEEKPKDYSNYYHRAIAYKNINENKLAEENITQAIKYCRQSNMDLRNRYNHSQMLYYHQN